jgi:hypothetical protein
MLIPQNSACPCEWPAPLAAPAIRRPCNGAVLIALGEVTWRRHHFGDGLADQPCLPHARWIDARVGWKRVPDDGVAESAISGFAIRRSSWRVRWWRGLVLSVVLNALSILLRLPQLPDGERSVDGLRQLSLRVCPGLILDTASLTVFGTITLLVFRPPRIRFRTVLRGDPPFTGLGQAVQARGASAVVLRLRLLRRARLSRSAATSGAAVDVTASNLVLGCLFLIGLLLLISMGDDGGSHVIVAGAVCAALVAETAFAWLLLHPSERLAGCNCGPGLVPAAVLDAYFPRRPLLSLVPAGRAWADAAHSGDRRRVAGRARSRCAIRHEPDGGTVSTMFGFDEGRRSS